MGQKNILCDRYLARTGAVETRERCEIALRRKAREEAESGGDPRASDLERKERHSQVLLDPAGEVTSLEAAVREHAYGRRVAIGSVAHGGTDRCYGNSYEEHEGREAGYKGCLAIHREW